MTVQSGQPLTISCKVSYSVTSLHTAWIRQPTGKTLEWIGYIRSGGSTAYKDSLKNKFSITRDTSGNTLFLKGQCLQPEDTAVYYCVRLHSDTNQHQTCTKTHSSLVQLNVSLSGFPIQYQDQSCTKTHPGRYCIEYAS
uniref:Ig-like domain-containing protein n=1 Tax=Hucho hucho TaxID=62062 RepID=A0A4W5KAD5_9TELE